MAVFPGAICPGKHHNLWSQGLSAPRRCNRDSCSDRRLHRSYGGLSSGNVLLESVLWKPGTVALSLVITALELSRDQRLSRAEKNHFPLGRTGQCRAGPSWAVQREGHVLPGDKNKASSLFP